MRPQLPIWSRGSCNTPSLFAAGKEFDGELKANLASSGIDVTLFFCETRIHYRVSVIRGFVLLSGFAHLKSRFGPDFHFQNFKQFFKPAESDRDAALSQSTPGNSYPSDTDLLFLQHDCSLT